MQANIFNQYKPYFSKILALSYPIVIGQLGIVLMGVADVVMVGKLEPINLAAVSLANSVYFLLAIIGIGTLTAISPLVAKAKAEAQDNTCAFLYRDGILASVLLALFLMLGIWFLTINLEWFKQTEEVTNLTKNYLHLLNVGTLPMLFFLALKQFSDGLSITKPAAIITILAVALNVFINWLLIYGNWGMPTMGLLGTGVATTVSRFAMAIAMFWYVHNNSRYKHEIKIKDKKVQDAGLKQIFSIGLPSGFQYFFEVGAFAFAAIMIGWIGPTELAAHQVAINIASVTYMIATGLSAAGSIAVGDALGRKNRNDIRKSGYAAMILAAVFMGFCAILFSLFNQQIVGFYIQDQAVAQMAQYLIIIAAFFQLSDGIQCVGLGILRGIGDTKVPTLIAIVAYWLIGIPMGYYLGFKTNLSLNGVWIALSFGLTFSALFLSFRFNRRSRLINLDYLQDAA